MKQPYIVVEIFILMPSSKGGSDKSAKNYSK